MILRKLLISVALVLIPVQALAASTDDLNSVNSNTVFYDANDSGQSCGSSGGAGSTETGNYTTILQAIAVEESGGDPKAGSAAHASGKFQFEPGSWKSAQQAYPPAQAYSAALDAPEDVQDAAAYLWALNVYKQYGQSPFWVAMNWYGSAELKYYPNQNAPQLNVVPGGNVLTYAQFGNLIAKTVQTGEYTGHSGTAAPVAISSIPMPFPSDFQTFLTANGGAPSDSTSGTTPATTPTDCSSANGGGMVGTAGADGWNISGANAMVSYAQEDPAWKNVVYGNAGTIGVGGCGPTSIAMVVATLTGNPAITPATIATQFAQYGSSGGTTWGIFPAVAEAYGLKETDLGLNWAAAAQILQQGGLVIISVDPGYFTKDGHIMVLRAVSPDGGSFYLNDPVAPGPVAGKNDDTEAFTTSFLLSPGNAAQLWGFTK